MYDAGAGACFDVMAVQGYGFYSGPTDRRLRTLTLNFVRHLYIRDLMVANGDAVKSIWISEAAWNAQPEDPAIVTSQYGNFGIVTENQAARYMPLGYQRALEEWPWIGNIAYWFFKRAADYERSQAFYYFRMVEPDFTPLPVYNSMKQYITTQQPALYPGVHQAEDWAVRLPQSAARVDAEGAEFGRAVETTSLRFDYIGTGFSLRLREPGAADWETRLYAENATTTRMSTEFVNLPAGTRVDSITVFDRTAQNRFPWAAAAAVALGTTAFVLIDALWRRTR
jgi:hypothetical protein